MVTPITTEVLKPFEGGELLIRGVEKYTESYDYLGRIKSVETDEDNIVVTFSSLKRLGADGVWRKHDPHYAFKQRGVMATNFMKGLVLHRVLDKGNWEQAFFSPPR